MTHFKLEDFFYLTPEFLESYNFVECDTRTKGVFHPQDVVAAILLTGGMYKDMVPLLGRPRHSIRDYIQSNEDIRLIWEEIQDGKLDDLEKGIFNSALAGNETDRRFLLSTLGKNRGFSTRTEATGKDGGPIETKPMSELEFARRVAFAMKQAGEDEDVGSDAPDNG